MKTFEIKLIVKVENEEDIKHILPAIEDGMEFSAHEGVESYEVDEIYPPRHIKWRGFDFILDHLQLNLVFPAYYESHLVWGQEPKQGDYICALVDYFDFRNRDLACYPILDNERKLIENNFCIEEVNKYFPELNNDTYTIFKGEE